MPPDRTVSRDTIVPVVKMAIVLYNACGYIKQIYSILNKSARFCAKKRYRLATERATLSIRFTLARVPSRSQSSRYSSLGLWYQDAIG